MTDKTPASEAGRSQETPSGEAAPPQAATTPIVRAEHPAIPLLRRIVDNEKNTVEEAAEVAQLLISNDHEHYIAVAERRKLVLQSEAAINIGIGVVLERFGQTGITIRPDELRKFNTLFYVEQRIDEDGTAHITVRERA